MPDEKRVWTTANGDFETCKKSQMSFLLPEFDDRTANQLDFNMTKQNDHMPHDVITGGLGLHSLGFNLMCEDLTIELNGAKVLVKDKENAKHKD